MNEARSELIANKGEWHKVTFLVRAEVENKSFTFQDWNLEKIKA